MPFVYDAKSNLRQWTLPELKPMVGKEVEIIVL